MTFRCSSKVRRKLGLRPRDLAPAPLVPVGTDWHCNVVTLLRRPFFLFAHTQSLFAFVAPTAGASRPELFGTMFREQALWSLGEEGITLSAARAIVDDSPDVFCKASDRRVIGTMVDHANMSRFVVEEEEATSARVLIMVRKHINSSPMSILAMDNPREAVKALLIDREAG